MLTDRARRVIAGLGEWGSRHERFLWAGLIVVVVVIQWPMLKGLYYRIPVLIDVDTDTSVGERYGVRGIPTVLVLDAAGQVVRRGDFLNASGMVKFLTRTR